MDQWLAILTPIFGVVAAIASTLAAITYSVTRTLREANNDLRARVSDYKAAQEDDAEKIAEQAIQIAQCGTEIETLKALVTGRVEWVAVSDLLEQHHSEANTHWTTTEGYLDRIARTMEGGKS